MFFFHQKKTMRVWGITPASSIYLPLLDVLHCWNYWWSRKRMKGVVLSKRGLRKVVPWPGCRKQWRRVSCRCHTFQHLSIGSGPDCAGYWEVGKRCGRKAAKPDSWDEHSLESIIITSPHCVSQSFCNACYMDATMVQQQYPISGLFDVLTRLIQPSNYAQIQSN